MTTPYDGLAAAIGALADARNVSQIHLTSACFLIAARLMRRRGFDEDTFARAARGMYRIEAEQAGVKPPKAAN